MAVACSSIWSRVLDLVAIFVSAVLNGSATWHIVKHQLSADTEPTLHTIKILQSICGVRAVWLLSRAEATVQRL